VFAVDFAVGTPLTIGRYNRFLKLCAPLLDYAVDYTKNFSITLRYIVGRRLCKVFFLSKEEQNHFFCI